MSPSMAAVFALLATALAVDPCDLRHGWRVCRAAGAAKCETSWPSPPLPTTALAALLANASADDASLFATPPALRTGEGVVDAYFSSNLAAIRDVNETGRAFYTLRWERELEGCAGRLLEIPGANYRATVYADGAAVASADAFGGMFARRRYVLPEGAAALALVVAPPDHCGSPTCADPNATCGQGGDHALARDVTAQFTLGWDWQQAIPDRSTGFFGVPTLTAVTSLQLRDAAVLTLELACEAAGSCGASADGRVAVVASVTNFGEEGKTGAVRASVAGRAVSLPFSVDPGATAELRAEVDVVGLDLWWPRGSSAAYGGAALNVATFSLGNATTAVAFGFRTFATYIDPRTEGRAFKVNGRRVFLRGGNWIATDALWRFSADARRYSDEVQLHAAAGLNLIRVWGGGVAEADAFYDACDRLGVLVYQEFWMTGDNNGRWAGSYDSPDDHGAYGVAVVDAVKRLRRFASLLWLGGGNELYPRERSPPPDLWAAILAAVAAHDGLKLVLPSTMDGGVLGGNESLHDDAYALVAKDGPYSMLLPESWSDRNPGLNATKYPGLKISLQPEIGSASAPGSVEGLARFLEARDLVAPTRDGAVPAAWKLHRFESFATGAYDHCYAYGDPENLADWVAFCSLAQFQQYQLLFESFAARAFEWYSGVIMWKTQSPWPSLRGFLYDWWLEPTGGHRGAAAANGARAVILDQRSREVVLSNTALDEAWAPGNASLRWFSLDGAPLATASAAVGAVAPTSAARTGLVAAAPAACAATTCLLRLTAGDATTNAYWLADPGNAGPDYSALGALRRKGTTAANLTATCDRDGRYGARIAVAVEAAAGVVVDPSFAVLEDGAALWPLFLERAQDLFVLPGERAAQVLAARPTKRAPLTLSVHLRAFTLAEDVVVDVECATYSDDDDDDDDGR